MDYFWSLPHTSVTGFDAIVASAFEGVQARKHAGGASLSDPSEAPSRAYRLVSGALKVSKVLSNGREILITILEPGALWSDRALIRGYWRETYIEAMASAQTVSVDVRAFEEQVFADGRAVAGLMQLIGEQVSDALTLLDDFRGRDVASRLASLIVRLTKQYGVQTEDAICVDIPFTHQDLANMIGTARETVTRNMTRFRAEGLLGDSGAATLEVRELAKLEALFA